ncbi:MAG: 2-oxoacid:ferredoxin oxidoreductase subunit beta [Alphaproteobacteria bacterium]|nr:2-oxoacid:ferredoxin oxidoreductase subunit beta [Alphaproteobacteria bacterium]|tara:strand:+ start:4621 stop:5643 length:1023 start_codon:yes stop_codon:yes gene_type:complete
MNVATKIDPLKAKDFASDQEVRWCPGCGDYAIIKAMQKTLADIGATRESTVFVSGIGCAARFPYYMSTYGFHTIHGRAAAISTGIKLANPDLDIWVASGDGDSLSIGGNHLLHLLRRNVNLQYLLFNNEIYGLTKGQYSPTSRMGTRSPSTPLGSVESPVSACEFALGSGARFVARGVDTQQKHLPGVFQRAWEHQGTSFVEILQNCIVYNDDVFAEFTAKDIAQDRQVHVMHGEPMIFGANEDKGLRVDAESLQLEVVTLGENGISESDILVHDETNPTLARMLATMEAPEYPVALGVLYCDPAETYDASVLAQVQEAKDRLPEADLDEYLRRGHTWTV